ncbi:DUF6928 family protein [Nonomuraea sp. ZG12]|uniref:DUF6928 family protein n=1 Tax=Nonomuraea sp. ZG12 TaxID=3452207 RepID=UPI003F888413
MGVKTAVLVYSDGDPADLLRGTTEPLPDATDALVSELNPQWVRADSSENALVDCLYPRVGLAYAASFSGADVICDRALAIDRPSLLPAHYLQRKVRPRISLHAMNGSSDWFAYAVWENGELIRSLSLDPDRGIVEDIGTPLAFEAPFWAGRHPVVAPGGGAYPLPFHPAALGAEAAMRALLGFILEGKSSGDDIDPEAIRMIAYRTPGGGVTSQAEVDDFKRTHRLVRYEFRSDGSMVPIHEEG